MGMFVVRCVLQISFVRKEREEDYYLHGDVSSGGAFGSYQVMATSRIASDYRYLFTNR